MSYDETMKRAWRAVEAFNKKKPQLDSLVRALSGRSIPVVAGSEGSDGSSATDGKRIYITPPISMGDRLTHNRSKCGKREQSTFAQLCEACRAEETLTVFIFHEIGHNVFNSFGTMATMKSITPSLWAKLVESKLLSDYQRARISAEYTHSGTQMSTFMDLKSNSGSFLMNVLEDIRIDWQTFQVRPGYKDMYRAKVASTFINGIENSHGETVRWNESPLDGQVLAACLLVGLGYPDLLNNLHPVAQDFGTDPVITEILNGVRDAKSVYQNTLYALEVIERAWELGLLDAPKPDPTPEQGESDADAEPEQGESDADSEPEQGESDADAEPEQGESDADAEPEQGESDADAGSGSGSGSGSGESEPEPEPGGSDAEPEPEPEPGESDTEPEQGESDTDTEPEQGESDADTETEQGESDTGPEQGDDTSSSGASGDGASDGIPGNGTPDSEAAPDGTPDPDSEAATEPEPDPEPEPEPAPEPEPEPATESEPATEPEPATEEDRGRAVRSLIGHETLHREDDENLYADRKDRNAVESAIIQSEYFDEPSSDICGTRVLTSDSDGSFDKAFRDSDLLDREVLIDVPELRDLAPSEALLSAALLHARHAFIENDRSSEAAHLKSGKINARVLGKRAPLNDARLFKKKSRPGKRDYSVIISMDASYSTTKGDRSVRQKKAVFAQAEILSRLGVKFSIIGHSAEADANGDKMVNVILRLKDFDEPWSTLQKSRVQKLNPINANIDGHTMEYLRKAMEKTNSWGKIIMYFTDGVMPYYNFEEELNILQKEIKTCARQGVTLFGVGIDTDSPSRHGLDTVQIDNESDMIKVIKQIERALS